MKGYLSIRETSYKWGVSERRVNQYVTEGRIPGAERFGRSRAIPENAKKPAIDFQYEVSFYFIDNKFEYALYAPDKSKRWILKEYNCTDEDIAFAGRFIEWNTVTHGIQRVDACRTNDGELLLVELEDLNPYLSILDVNEKIRHIFLNDMMETLEML